MNPLNYASLEASKRLADAGIVLLNAEHWWWKRHANDEWFVDLFPKVDCIVKDDRLPAPSMAEVWRELPEEIDNYYLVITADQGITRAEYRNTIWQLMEGCPFESINSTDALIDLLIWAKQHNQRSGE